MTQVPLPLSRRAFVGASLLLVPLAAKASWWQSWERRFRERLVALDLPVAAARIEVLRFEHTHTQTASHMDATVEMTWPDGTRRRRLRMRATTPPAAVDGLVDQVAEVFHATA